MRKRTRTRTLNLNRIFSTDALESAVKIALFVGETMRDTKYSATAPAVLKTAQAFKGIFLVPEKPDDLTALRLRALTFKLKRLDPIKDAALYAETQQSIDELLELHTTPSEA